MFLLRFREGEVEETRGDPLLLGACPVPSLLASAGADLGEEEPRLNVPRLTLRVPCNSQPSLHCLQLISARSYADT